MQRCIHANDGGIHGLVSVHGNGRCRLCNSRSARKGIGAAECRRGLALRARLVEGIVDEETRLYSYVRDLSRRVRATRWTVPVFLFEVCCDSESALSSAVARNGGAAIRIVQPSNASLRDSPGFKAGRAVSWEVDMTKATNVDMVEECMRKYSRSDRCIRHVHFSCMCTGTTTLEAPSRRRVGRRSSRYRSTCRALLYRCRRVYKRMRSDKVYTGSAEQPVHARGRKMGYAERAVYPYIIHTRNKVPRSVVSLCMCGMKHKGKPYCRSLGFESDNTSLRLVLSLLACPGSCSRSSERVSPSFLKASAKYPRILGELMALALCLPFFKGRRYVL